MEHLLLPQFLHLQVWERPLPKLAYLFHNYRCLKPLDCEFHFQYLWIEEQTYNKENWLFLSTYIWRYLILVNTIYLTYISTSSLGKIKLTSLPNNLAFLAAGIWVLIIWVIPSKLASCFKTILQKISWTHSNLLWICNVSK